jgi:hypothetical protein
MADSKHPVTEFDFFFLSYDEPNADKHWADLLDKAPWAERVHGVKGFAAAHEACAEKSTTDWFVTVDADNVVMPEFLEQEVVLDIDGRPNLCYTWNGLNMMNGLMYGNGGIKLWSKKFVLEGGVGHEHSDDPRHSVDFCWQPDYVTLPETFSWVHNNGSAYQAFRVGFREAVKLTLDQGLRVDAKEMKKRLHEVNLRNIRIWSCVGGDKEFGDYAMLGARMGWTLMLDPEWPHEVIRDFDWFDTFWETKVVPEIAETEGGIARLLTVYGSTVTQQTGIVLPILGDDESIFFRETFRYRNV